MLIKCSWLSSSNWILNVTTCAKKCGRSVLVTVTHWLYQWLKGVARILCTFGCHLRRMHIPTTSDAFHSRGAIYGTTPAVFAYCFFFCLSIPSFSSLISWHDKTKMHVAFKTLERPRFHKLCRHLRRLLLLLQRLDLEKDDGNCSFLRSALLCCGWKKNTFCQ